jgi:hypothetical protein
MSEPNVTAAATTLDQLVTTWDLLTPEERKEAAEEALECLVVEGERVMQSAVTDEAYRVTKWIDLGDGKVTAIEKEPVEEVAQTDD